MSLSEWISSTKLVIIKIVTYLGGSVCVFVFTMNS